MSRLTDAKKKLSTYTDFYGGDIISKDEIHRAKSFDDLEKVVQRHLRYIEDMSIDAKTHLETFRSELYSIDDLSE
jgi:hypothetical protein